MPSQIADVADINSKVISWLPLNVESLIERIGKLVGSIVICKGEKRLALRDPRRYSLSWNSRVGKDLSISAGFPLGFVGAVVPHGVANVNPAEGSHVGMKKLYM